MSERDLQRIAADELRAAGFLVEVEARAALERSKREVIADLVAWGGDEDGELVRDVVVETKANLEGHFEGALAQLSRVVAVMGARRAFLFDGRWLEVDPTFTRVTPTSCPRPVVAPASARIPDAFVAQRLWDVRNEVRGTTPMGGRGWIEAALTAAAPGAGTTLSKLCENPRARIAVARLIGADGDFGVAAELALAMARLLAPEAGWTVLDPMCALGGCLWATALVAREAAAAVSLIGWDALEKDRGIAERLGRLCDAGVRIELRGTVDVLESRANVEGLVSVLPFGVHMQKRVNLADGSTTAELDGAMLDRVVRWLKPGGRAVVALAPRLLFSDEAVRLREELARTVRVVAVVELPSGLVTGTKIPVGLLVLEKRAPGETLVAKLTEDWAAQLAPAGAFFRAYREHLTAVGR